MIKKPTPLTDVLFHTGTDWPYTDSTNIIHYIFMVTCTFLRLVFKLFYDAPVAILILNAPKARSVRGILNWKLIDEEPINTFARAGVLVGNAYLWTHILITTNTYSSMINPIFGALAFTATAVLGSALFCYTVYAVFYIFIRPICKTIAWLWNLPSLQVNVEPVTSSS